MKDKSTAPKDGTRILIQHFTIDDHFSSNSDTRWVEARWIDNEQTTGNKPHWEPWRGDERSSSTDHIKHSNVIRWMKRPA